jgi:PPK2 family polyphosphate:nucleotide phosphotransferase
VLQELVVEPGRAADLKHRSTSSTRANLPAGGSLPKARDLAERDLESFRESLSAAQELLYASSSHALLVILQALDAAGKDGTIKHVMSGLNPQGCEVLSFRAPSQEELGHDFLWRCSRVLPARGRIGIFNRSYYEDLLVPRVHPELVDDQHLPPGSPRGEKLWAQREQDINDFERHLERSGTRVVKLFLHVSKDEQRRRLLERLDQPSKYWKFSPSDLAERAHFEEYQRAYEATITATSTPSAPWYVVPADHKHVARALVGAILVAAVEQLQLRVPEPSAEQRAVLEAARVKLLAE